MWYDPFFTQSHEARKTSPLLNAPRKSQSPDLAVFSNWDQPNMFRITLPGQSGSGELSGQEGQATATAHPGTISSPSGLGSAKGLPTPQHATLVTPGPTPSRVPILDTFVPLELQLHVNYVNSCVPMHPMISHALQMNYRACQHHA